VIDNRRSISPTVKNADPLVAVAAVVDVVAAARYCCMFTGQQVEVGITMFVSSIGHISEVNMVSRSLPLVASPW